MSKINKFTLRRAMLIAFIVSVMISLSSCGYNQIQTLEESVFRSFGDLQAQLQRRYDLIPNLVETVKAYANHEQETLTAVTEARARVGSIQIGSDIIDDPEKLSQFQQAQGELGSALSRLMVVSENYPELRANENFLDLQNQLEGTENRISVSRQRYNEAVEQFNGSIRRFPGSMTNNLFLKLERKEYFQASIDAEEAPRVQF